MHSKAFTSRNCNDDILLSLNLLLYLNVFLLDQSYGTAKYQRGLRDDVLTLRRHIRRRTGSQRLKSYYL
jgi:hypothetical protein